MFEGLKSRLWPDEAIPLSRSLVPPSHANINVPIVRAEVPLPTGRSMGYLERSPDSTRPALAMAPALRTADHDIRAAWGRASAHARNLIQNSGFLAYGVEYSCAVTVGGDGLIPNVVPDAAALGWTDAQARDWSRQVETGFARWSHDPLACDSMGRMKFGALLNAAFKSYLASGDVIAVMDYGQKRGTDRRSSINIIDPSRIATPPPYASAKLAAGSVYDGIEFDDRGRATAYWVKDSPGSHGSQWTSSGGVRVPVWGSKGTRLLVHTYDAEPGTIRGISPLAAAIAAVMQTQNVTDAAILAAHVAAMIVGVITSDLPSESVMKALGAEGGDPIASMMASRAAWHEGLKENKAHVQLGHNARVVHLTAGERLDLLAGKTNFTDYALILKTGLREAARALGLSPEHLDGDKSQATYSSLKVAAVELRSIVERRRKIIVEPLCEFALNAVVEEMIDRGELPFPSRPGESALDAYRANRSKALRVEWRGPEIADPDPLKAVRAAALKVTSGLSSLTDEIAATGRDAEAVFRQRRIDEDMLKELGLELPWPVQPTRARS